MRSKLIGFLAAVLVSGNAAADTLRYRAQPELGRTWLIESEGLFVEEAGKPRRAIVLPGWLWAAPGHACPPGVAIGPHGEAVVTSNVLPVLWKIDPHTLAVSVHRLQLEADRDKDVGFSGIVYRNGAYFAVSDVQGSLWKIDPLMRRAQKIAASEELRGACAVPAQSQARVALSG